MRRGCLQWYGDVLKDYYCIHFIHFEDHFSLNEKYLKANFFSSKHHFDMKYEVTFSCQKKNIDIQKIVIIVLTIF